MGVKQDKTSQFVSEMSERQISVREFFSTVLLDLLKQDFGLEKAIIMMFDPEGNFLSWITGNGIEIAEGSHPYQAVFGKDPVRRVIYEDAVRDQLTYFNLEPRIYRATDFFESEEAYDRSELVQLTKDLFDSYYTLALAFGINAYIQICFFKSKEEGDFTDEEILRFSEIYQYVAINYKGFKKHEHMKIISNIKDEIITSGESAYLITDDFMHLLSYNEEAINALEEALGPSVRKQISSGSPCLWLPFLLEGSGRDLEEGSVETREIRDMVFKIYTYEQSYSHGIVDRYHWITISKREKTAERSRSGNLEILTPSEQNIAKLLCTGKTYRSIADELSISYHTVKNHVQNIFSKCGVRNRYELYEMFRDLTE